MSKTNSKKQQFSLKEHHDKCSTNGNFSQCSWDCPMYEFSRTGALATADMIGLSVTCDNSESYSINKAALIKTKTGWAIVHVMGCSCWEGEGYVYVGKTAEEAMKSFEVAKSYYDSTVDDLKRLWHDTKSTTS